MLPSHPKPLLSLYNNDKSTHASNASGAMPSIWAPQPQPSDTTWPKTIDAFSTLADHTFNQQSRPKAHIPPFRERAIGKEDVFGPVGFLGLSRTKDVGAIGDGRKKNSANVDNSVRL